jgi:hypothetical protein
MFALLRSESDMYEAFSTDQGTSWTMPVACGVGAHSAARILFDPTTGDIYWLGRPNAALRSTLYRRDAVTGTWDTIPTAPGINASEGTCIYGALLFDSPGKIAMISGSQIGATVGDTNAAIYSQKWDTFQLRGQLPLIPSPASPAAQAPGGTIQFTARGAGNYTYAVHTNLSGGSINGTGLYTRGASAGVDVVRITDLNGYYIDVNVDGTVASFPDSANLTFHFDASVVGEVFAPGGLATSVTNEAGASSALTQASGGLKPAYGTSTQNSLKTLDFSAGKIMNVTLPGSGVASFTDFAFGVAFKTGATVAGLQALGGSATGGVVCRIDAGVLRVVDYTAGPVALVFTDLTVTANTAHVAVFRRTGSTWEAWLDGVKSAVTGTLTANDIPVVFPIGNDDATTLFGEQWLGYIFEPFMWNHAPTSGNIVSACAGLKTKWATT